MRILVDAVAARAGGGLSRSHELARTLPELRPDNEHMFVVQPDVAKQVTAIDARIRTLVPPRGLRRPPLRLGWEHLALPRAARAFRPDAIFAPFGIGPLGWRAPRPAYAVIVSNLAPYSKLVVKEYRGLAARRLDLLRRLTDATLARADRIFLLSNQAFDLIDHRLLDGKAELIPMAPPSVPHGLADVKRPARPYIVIACDIMRYKGIELVLAALAGMSPRERPLLIICGRFLEPDYVQRLRAQVTAKGLERDVEFRGPTPHLVVLGLIQGAVACVTPARFENLSRVPVEAMALGTPVVASDIPSYRETCGEAGLYFPLTEPMRLADHLRTLIRDGSARAHWGRQGVRHTSRMRPSDASSRIIEGLESLVGQGR